MIEYCTEHGFIIGRLSVDQSDPASGTVSVTLAVQGGGSVSGLATRLSEIDGVLTVSSDDTNAPQL